MKPVIQYDKNYQEYVKRENEEWEKLTKDKPKFIWHNESGAYYIEQSFSKPYDPQKYKS